MAQAEGSLDLEDLSCSICLEVLKNPVTILCGHNYCMDCIKGYWNQDDHTGVYSCPQCRETFTPRPVLRKNTMLAEVVEKLKKTGPYAAPPAEPYIRPEDVMCDICTERRKIAVKSCLVCRASYCQSHLQPHFKCPDFRRHKLVKATVDLPERASAPQEQLVVLHCCTDQLCFNALCVMNEHRGSATARRTKKKVSRQRGKTAVLTCSPYKKELLEIKEKKSAPKVKGCKKEKGKKS